ncbi:MAG: hypothetical protein ACM3SS_03905 [Rhodospirillaceae bacterium]
MVISRRILLTIAFVLASPIVWWSSNWGIISSPDGFDPLRYEYYAREGLPSELLLSSSYRVVLLLQTIYEALPFYWGYVIFAAALLVLVLWSNRDRHLAVALLSPISFYFFAQTGKDWITILALSCFAIALRRFTSWTYLILCGLIVMLAVFLRPSLLPVLVVLFVVVRRGVILGGGISVVAGAALYLTGDFPFMLDLLGETVQQEDSGQYVRLMRELTFGYAAPAIILKFALYYASIIFQPLLALAKAVVAGSAGTYVLFEGACLTTLLWILVRSGLLNGFLWYSLPFCVLLALTSPFYHFRYVEIIYPVLLSLAGYTGRQSRGLRYAGATTALNEGRQLRPLDPHLQR